MNMWVIVRDMTAAMPHTKIHDELGWLPETKFEDGIKTTVHLYLDNRSWWENIISGDYQVYYEVCIEKILICNTLVNKH